MARPKIFSNDELIHLLARIEIQYGFLSFDTIHKAHLEDPFEIPSERTFRRAMGGMKIFNSPDFREKLEPLIDKLKQK